jgi:glucokinase
MTASGNIMRLLADVGGTNARFAWQNGAGTALQDHAVYRCADHVSLQAAIEHNLSEHPQVRPEWAAIGIANPVLGDAVRMTNHHWVFSISRLQ